jgi:hypothetical protein
MDKFSGPRSKLSCFGYFVSVKFYYCVALFRLLNIYRYNQIVWSLWKKRDEKKKEEDYFILQSLSKIKWFFRAFDFHCYSITISKPFIFQFVYPQKRYKTFLLPPFIDHLLPTWFFHENSWFGQFRHALSKYAKKNIPSWLSFRDIYDRISTIFRKKI